MEVSIDLSNLHRLFSEADVVRLPGSCASFNTVTVVFSGELWEDAPLDSELIRLTWDDSEGLEFEIRFTKEGLIHALWDASLQACFINDHESDRVQVQFFKLLPMSP